MCRDPHDHEPPELLIEHHALVQGAGEQRVGEWRALVGGRVDRLEVRVLPHACELVAVPEPPRRRVRQIIGAHRAHPLLLIGLVTHVAEQVEEVVGSVG